MRQNGDFYVKMCLFGSDGLRDPNAIHGRAGNPARVPGLPFARGRMGSRKELKHARRK